MQQTSLAFPRPGPALKGLLIVVAVLGIGLALAGDLGLRVFRALACTPAEALHGQVWRLLTSALLTDPTSYGHLIFSLMGLYFLSTDLEQRWGGRRFLGFLAGASVLGNVLAIAVDAIAPASFRNFHAELMFGPEAAIAATAIAWASMNADRQILLFFVVPVRGLYLTWVTIGFCLLGLVYRGGAPAGHIAPFGGVIVGLLFGGGQTTSPLRRMYLQMKLWFIRRRLGDKAPPTVESMMRTPAKKRTGGPPLRVVSGGLDDKPEKKPPKDKRYLN
ncbi:MAG: rhomboid family intramembrane serine protease [Polyangiaceae bacterium]